MKNLKINSIDRSVFDAAGVEDVNVVAFDGYSPLELQENDMIIIEKSETWMKLAKLDDSSFLQVLKNKMGDR